MFNNVGEKIKIIAKWFGTISCAICIVVAIVFFWQGVDAHSSYRAGSKFITAFCFLGGGIISFISSLSFYGFGIVVEYFENKSLTHCYSDNDAKSNFVSYKVCRQCNSKVPKNTVMCPECGARVN